MGRTARDRLDPRQRLERQRAWIFELERVPAHNDLRVGVAFAGVVAFVGARFRPDVIADLIAGTDLALLYPGLLAAPAVALLVALAILPHMQIEPSGVVFAPRFLYLPLLLGVPLVSALVRLLVPSRPARALLPALCVLLVAGAWLRATENEILPDLALSLGGWSVLLLLPPATALVAMLTARLTVLRSLARMP